MPTQNYQIVTGVVIAIMVLLLAGFFIFSLILYSNGRKKKFMQEKQIRRLPVLTREKQLAGIVALGDLATKTDDVQQVGRTMRQVSQRSTGTGT